MKPIKIAFIVLSLAVITTQFPQPAFSAPQMQPAPASCLPAGPIKILDVPSTFFNGFTFGFDQSAFISTIKSGSQIISFSAILKFNVGSSISSYLSTAPWAQCNMYVDAPVGRPVGGFPGGHDIDLSCPGIPSIGWPNSAVKAIVTILYRDCR